MVYPLFISSEIERLMEEGFIILLLIGNILDLIQYFIINLIFQIDYTDLVTVKMIYIHL